jgi:hypothetical protein
MTATDYLSQHAELIAARSVEGLSAGVAAALSRKIGQCELELSVADIPYEPWSPASQVAASLADKTAEELTAMHETAIQTRRDATTSGTKAAGTIAVRRVEAEMTRREMTFTPWAADKSVTGGMTDEELTTRIEALTRLLNAPNLRPRIQKIAAKELDQLTMTAQSRGLSAAPADDSSPVDTGAMLDQVTDQVADAVNADTKPRKRSTKTAA